MNQESCPRAIDAIVPGDELSLVGMGREAVDRMDTRPYRNILSEYPNDLCSLDNTSGERASRRESYEYDASRGVRKVAGKVMSNAATGAHAGPGYDDSAALDPIDRN